MITKSHRPRPEGGFSLVEVLIAAALLLVIAIGILPLFTRAIANNQQGQQATQAVHRANSEIEELMQVDFNAADLAVPSGNTELLRTEYWNLATKAWEANKPAQSEYERTIRVRQFNLDSLRNSSATRDWTPLPGTALPSEVHLKEIEITVRSAGGVGGAAPRQLTLKTLKAF